MRQKQYIAIGILTAILAAGGFFAVPLQANAKSSHNDTADMSWWKHDRFGMFIHWGLYSVAAGYWNGKPINGQSAMVESTAHVPRAQWARLACRGTAKKPPAASMAVKIPIAMYCFWRITKTPVKLFRADRHTRSQSDIHGAGTNKNIIPAGKHPKLISRSIP